MKEKALFENLNYCSRCKRPLPKSYTEDMCPPCQAQALFERVKEYIRNNDVNEHQVAEHFDIPLSTVKNWIREGRIEYKESADPKIKGLFCQKCGAPVSFGTLCTNCMREANGQHGYSVYRGGKNNKMRFLDGKDTDVTI